LWWGLRRYLWILLITIPAAAAIFIAAGSSGFGRNYEASALVVVSKPTINLAAYPRFVESVFAGGTVAERAVNEGHLSISPARLIPDHAELDPVEENIAFRVIGLHTDRRLAADIANAVASALVAQLNEIGPDVGAFKVQDIARVPEAASDAVSGAPVLGVLGAAMGLLVGAGLVGMVLTLRRPVLGAEEAAALVGAPLAGAPTLPAKKGLPPEGSRVPGLAAVVKRLYPTAQGTIVLISPPASEELRTVIAQLISIALGREAPTFLVSSRDESVRWLYEHFDPGARVVVTNTLPDAATWTRVPIVIDGPSARGSDAPQMIPEMARIVLVVRQGVPRTRLLEVASQFLPGEIAGVLFVRRGTSWPWLVSPRTPITTELQRPAQTAPAPAPAPTLSPIPTPATAPAPPVQNRYVQPSPPQERRAPTVVGRPMPASPGPGPQRPGGEARRDERPYQMPPRPQPLHGQPRREPRPIEIIDLDDLGKERRSDAERPGEPEEPRPLRRDGEPLSRPDAPRE
jgi:hypothetical protein